MWSRSIFSPEFIRIIKHQWRILLWIIIKTGLRVLPIPLIKLRTRTAIANIKTSAHSAIKKYIYIYTYVSIQRSRLRIAHNFFKGKTYTRTSAWSIILHTHYITCIYENLSIYLTPDRASALDRASRSSKRSREPLCLFHFPTTVSLLIGTYRSVLSRLACYYV